MTSLPDNRFTVCVTPDLIAVYLRLGLAWQAVVEAVPADMLALASAEQAKPYSAKLAGLDNLYWMTRINVPHDFRRCGYGSLLLKKFLQVTGDNNINVLCFPSSSDPKLTQANLRKFYTDRGFEALDPKVLYLHRAKGIPMQEAVANAPRSLTQVLDSMFEVAPDIKQPLESVYRSSQFAAPEMQSYWWQQAALVLNQCAMKHDKATELMAIFSGAK